MLVIDASGHTATFAYDPFGNLVRSVDPAGNVTANSYDQRGRKIASSNPDMGNWSYSYNVLDQLVSQTDAKGRTTAVSYDVLGRVVQRAEADLTSNWSYDSAPMASASWSRRRRMAATAAATVTMPSDGRHRPSSPSTARAMRSAPPMTPPDGSPR